MKNFYDSRLYRVLSVATTLMGLSLLTVLCSLPLFTAGASMTALYAVLEAERDGSGGAAMREFFRAFKKHFKRATLLWLALLAVLGLAAGDLLFVSQGMVAGNSFFFLCFAYLILIIAVMTASVLFPFLPVFKAGFRQTIRISLVYSLKYLPKTVLITALNIFPFVLAYLYTEFFMRFLPVWPLIGFAAIAYCNTAILSPVILSVQEALDEQAGNKENPASEI